ncbi:AAA family ATPase [Nocardioides sp. CPCC 206347]|uniref:AAA family ATPase n=1 Tax=unclassified Nocardioides TaxID=2615069 RepID=UPI0036161FA1
MIVVLLVSSGAAWESRGLAALQDHPGTVVLKRCVDVDDLLAAASTGQAEVAVLGVDLPGLDQGVVDDLTRYGVRVVGIATGPDVTQPRAARIGITTLLDAARIDELGALVTALPADATLPAASVPLPGEDPAPTLDGALAGRVIAVWGPGGAPGRTMLASGVAAELARRGLSTLLVDADPYGGAVAQQLGILDEVSGLLAAARLVASGTLEQRFVSVQRRLSDQLRVITGLPRADRWVEVRPGSLTEIVEAARRGGQVVIDTGFSIEHDTASDLGRPGRNDLTREALEIADEVLLVGSADPVGLARLARAMTELNELLVNPPVRIVVNRMRPTLGWREPDVVAMLNGFGTSLGVHFLPDDQPAVDKALVAGRLLVESGDSALTRAIGALLDAMASTRTRGLAGRPAR